LSWSVIGNFNGIYCKNSRRGLTTQKITKNWILRSFKVIHVDTLESSSAVIVAKISKTASIHNRFHATKGVQKVLQVDILDQIFFQNLKINKTYVWA